MLVKKPRAEVELMKRATELFNAASVQGNCRSASHLQMS